MQIEVAGRRLALRDRTALAHPVRAARGGEFGELHATVRWESDFPCPGGGEHFEAALKVDQFTEHRQRNECAARGVGGRAERLSMRVQSSANPVGLVGVELRGVRGHLLMQFVAQSHSLRLEGRQVRARERHEERLLPVVRGEAVAGVEVAQLLMGVNLFLCLIRADEAQRERRGLQHAVAA